MCLACFGGFPLFLSFVSFLGCTVTLCHIFTADLKKHTVIADVIVSAAGVAGLISKEHCRQGAIVIDVGINFVPDETKASGFRLVGDVDFESVKDVCSFITPVPNGVGPVTSALVLDATAEGKRQKEIVSFSFVSHQESSFFEIPRSEKIYIWIYIWLIDL